MEIMTKVLLLRTRVRMVWEVCQRMKVSCEKTLRFGTSLMTTAT
uniref:Uncharacterized protein n=1 Tax=Arundo donax TaxID=35708 RepID=A0A0A9CB57_ARUDO